MDLKQAMETRHAVRAFTDQPLAEEAVKELKQETEQVNLESGLHIQLVTDEPEAFDAGKPHYGSFSGCRRARAAKTRRSGTMEKDLF